MTGIRGLVREHLDEALGAVLGTAAAVELLLTGEHNQWLSVPAALAAGAAVTQRRRTPVRAFVATWAALLLIGRAEPGWADGSVTFLLFFFVSLYSLGAWARGRAVLVSALLATAAVVLFVLNDGDRFQLGDVIFALGLVGGPWAAGVAIAVRRNREEQLTVDNERAVAAERARIARELHDVVSHAIAVTVLQARGGRRMVGLDDEAVRRALDAIEQTNTAALGDMRRLLAVLRDTENGDGRPAPQPSLESLDALVDHVRASGLPVDVTVTGVAGPVPPGVDLSAYRIIQEALTNVLKHAGPGAHATVAVHYDGEALSVSVTDDGRGAPDGDGGHGLVGIRERVAVVGGAVEAGPGPTGGFQVRARLPFSVDA